MSQQKSFKVNYISTGDNPDKLKLLVREYNGVDKTQQYNKCPVFKHRKNRTFVGYSPVDFKLGFDSGTLWSSDPDCINSVNVTDPDHPTELVFQLEICNFALWTDEPDVWLDYSSHPLTSLNNNFTVVEGWFNISNWSRDTSLATRLVDKNKPLIIKKGDPLFRITFLSPDLNRGVILKERTRASKLKFHLSKNKDYKEGNKLFAETKKCPFPFLHFLSK